MRAALRSGLSCLCLCCAGLAPQHAAAVQGIAWQPDNATVRPQGQWEKLGAYQLLVQWTAVDGVAFVAGAGMPEAPQLPDWQRIGKEPWAGEVILGLAGRFSESAARADLANLVAQSERLAQLPTPLNVVGWYFPVEVDPSWEGAAQLAPLLAKLPRPLWISVYDSRNVGAAVMADQLARWLPDDVGLLFQDGCGVHAREAGVARVYADTLSARFGKERVRVIVEAFRPAPGGGFRSATAQELEPQLAAFKDYPVYLFDGPHYLPQGLTNSLAATLDRTRQTNPATAPDFK